MKRISTGIPGLDEMIDGGYPFPSTILICGEPGTGKTTFAVQSLFHGGRKGERSLFISTIAEPTDSIKRFLSGFTFYSQEVVDKGDMIFTDVGDTLRKEPAEISGVIKRAVYEYKPKRISIDTLTAIKDILGPTGFREFIYDLL
jgi:circadian clock protein KaiC